MQEKINDPPEEMGENKTQSPEEKKKQQIENWVRHQKMLSALVKNGFENLSKEEMAYWMNAY